MTIGVPAAPPPPPQDEGVQRHFLALLASLPQPSEDPHAPAMPPLSAFPSSPSPSAPPPPPSSHDATATPTPGSSPAPAAPSPPPRFIPSVAHFTPELDEPAEQTCALIGPPGAGKTSLLAALDAACLAEGADGEAMALVWNRQSDAADLLQRAARHWIDLDEALPPTTTSTTYAVELTSVHRSPLLERRSMRVTQLRLLEEPGHVLFPARLDEERAAPPLTSRQHGELSHATTLVLAVDAGRRCAATLEATIPNLLDRLAKAQPGERLDRSCSSGLLARVGLRSRRPAPRRSRLGVKRMLLLLTKIDVLASTAAHAQRATGEQVSALAVARALDPVGLALEVVGARSLRRLRRALGAEADFAVGLVSASGFHAKSGAPFSSWSATRSPDERAQVWAPFGVADALRFLAHGRCGPTVQPITEEELAADEIRLIARHAFQGAG